MRNVFEILITACLIFCGNAFSQIVNIDATNAGKQQVIDGFGSCLAGDVGGQTWFQDLYFDDANCSILRFDMTPTFKSPYSDNTYNSPWFHSNPSLPGPDNNNVRTYTNAIDYKNSYAGNNAQIAIMGPNIDANINLFDFTSTSPKIAGIVAKIGESKKVALGDFKITGSIWSPMPWIKIASGNTYQNSTGILPANNTPYPFIWGGNFVGGKIDVSNTPLAVFFDGVENTSALTQFSRATAAFIRGFQNLNNVKLYSFSLQNELNFETFYNSAYYPLSSQYIAAVVAIRKELDKYPDLMDIKIMGPEDLLSGADYALWQYGGGETTVHKNLQYLQNIAANTEANNAISYFNIHGYASDGIASAGGNPVSWDRWANGWTTSPAPGIPANVSGFRAFGKKSWMTETSGENTAWLWPTTSFPNKGGFSIALNIYQALTSGYQNGYVYWQMADDGVNASESTLTGSSVGVNSPKYIAFKHFSKYIRPNAIRLNATVSGTAQNINSTAFLHESNKTLTYVLINSDNTTRSVTVNVPNNLGFTLNKLETYTSSNNNYWQTTTNNIVANQVNVSLPAYSVTTLYGKSEDVLTVNLLNFTAKGTPIGNVLKWRTGTELNCLGFDISKSTDGLVYSKINFQKSQAVNGNSVAPLNYTYTDTEIIEKEVFYKLSEIDLNGNIKNYNPVLVKPILNVEDVKIYPNPATNTFYISCNQLNAQVNIFTVNGKIIKSLITTDKVTPVDISKLANGIYVIKVQYGTKIAIKKLIISK